MCVRGVFKVGLRLGGFLVKIQIARDFSDCKAFFHSFGKFGRVMEMCVNGVIFNVNLGIWFMK